MPVHLVILIFTDVFVLIGTCSQQEEGGHAEDGEQAFHEHQLSAIPLVIELWLAVLVIISIRGGVQVGSPELSAPRF